MTVKLKVLHITFDMRIGGTEMVIKNIIEGCDNSRFEMSIFCIEEPLGPWGLDLHARGVAIEYVSRKQGLDFSVISTLRTYIKTHKIDIVHCHQYTPWVYGAFAAIGLKAKVIFTEHGRFYPDSSSLKRKAINPLLTSLTASITAISNATKDALIEYEFIRPSRIQVIYNGIAPLNSSQDSAKVRESYGVAANTLLLGTIARFDSIKNHPMMLKALRLCLDMGLDVKLMIVGDGETRQEIESIIDDLQLDTYVILTGYKSNPASFLNAFDLYLLSSFSEGTSMTLLEAMCLSKPCIVTDVGGNPEVIKHQLNGVVIKSNDHVALANSIKAMINDPAKIRIMAIESKNRYERLFTANEMSKQYASLYQGMSV